MIIVRAVRKACLREIFQRHLGVFWKSRGSFLVPAMNQGCLIHRLLGTSWSSTDVQHQGLLVPRPASCILGLAANLTLQPAIKNASSKAYSWRVFFLQVSLPPFFFFFPRKSLRAQARILGSHIISWLYKSFPAHDTSQTCLMIKDCSCHFLLLSTVLKTRICRKA